MNGDVEYKVDPDTIPPANNSLRWVAGILLVIPIVALLWVGHYAKEEPTLAGWPFFIWYQFLWIVICSAMTFVAYRLVRIARPHRPLGSGRREG
ncbi:MAG: DUF3311 domain-containing protein [Gemmatimonadetes bacterium]|nr:DUF3311 domain-containing protein [Gemmatimonadota bacterium]